MATRHGVSWMTREIKELIRERQRARKRNMKYRSLANWRKYKALAARVKKAVKQAKESERERFHASFTKENAHHKLRQLQPRPKLPHCIEDAQGEWLVTDREIADELCSTFANVGRPEGGTEEIWHGAPPETKHSEFESDITREEVEAVVRELKPNKAPGRDGLYPWMLKHGGPSMIDALLHLFQGCWREGKIPAAWRFADIRPIMKQSAAKTAGDFRPISLLAVPSKVYDSIVLARLQAVSDTQQWVPHYQAGFRKHRSAIEHLVQLQQEAHIAFKRREFLVVAFLDISKAYDCVSRPMLVQKLENLGVNARMLAFLQCFLGKRFASVRYDTETSSVHEFQYGVPQGSPISPLLFNIYCADALRRCEGGKVLQADDMCVWRRHRNQDAACELLSDDLLTVHEFGTGHQLRFSVKKCKVLVITRKPRPKWPTVLFGGQVLEVLKKHKYLGVVIDEGLTWKDHIKYIREKATTRLRLVLRLSGRKSGVRQELLVQLYCSLIRPLLEYASEVWGDASRTRTKSLDTVQHRALTAALGVNRRSHQRDVCVEAGVPPLTVRRQVQLLRFWISIQKHPRPLTQYLETIPPEHRLREKHRFSFLERFDKLVPILGIPRARMLELSKERMQTVTRNLWRRERQNEAPKRTDPRSVNYRQVQREIELTKPEGYRRAKRQFCSLWHELRLGTAPMRWFLKSIERAETETCICGTGPETVPHFLLECSIHTEQRTQMLQSIQAGHAPAARATLAKVLTATGGSFEAVVEFLEATSRFS